MQQRALIVGGSIAGLTAAHLLRRDGWQVDVLERSSGDMADQGGGIATQEGMWRIFAAAGLDVADRPGIRLNRRSVFGRNGAVVATRAGEETVSSWDALYRLLRDGFPAAHYHQGCKVERVDEIGDQVEAVTEHNRWRADLLVAADGVGSTVRCQLLPTVEPRYANYVAWRGLVEEDDLPASASELVDQFSFCVAPHEQMLSYTVPGKDGSDEPGRRRHNFVWYRPAEPERALPDLLTDDEGHTHHPNIPAAKIRADIVAAMRRAAERLLSPAYAALVAATEKPALQPINDHLCSRMAFGRVVLIGDAAAQVRPHTGAGTSKAVEDADALAAALREETDIPAALRLFEERRQPVAAAAVEHGRWLGRHLDPANASGGDDQSPDVLLDTVAKAKI